MYWFCKSYPFGTEWARDQDVIAELQFKLAAQPNSDYRKLIMLCQSTERGDDIYICLPQENLLAFFPGYQPVDHRPDYYTSKLLAEEGFFSSLSDPPRCAAFGQHF